MLGRVALQHFLDRIGRLPSLVSASVPVGLCVVATSVCGWKYVGSSLHVSKVPRLTPLKLREKPDHEAKYQPESAHLDNAVDLSLVTDNCSCSFIGLFFLKCCFLGT